MVTTEVETPNYKRGSCGVREPKEVTVTLEEDLQVIAHEEERGLRI